MGDTVDVKYEDGKTMGWLPGQIKSVQGDELKVLLPQVGVFCMLDRWSCQIQKTGKISCGNYEWRKSCLEDPALSYFLIQCHDGYKWEEATII